MVKPGFLLKVLLIFPIKFWKYLLFLSNLPHVISDLKGQNSAIYVNLRQGNHYFYWDMIRIDMFIFSQTCMHIFNMVSVLNSCITYIKPSISYTVQNEDRQRKMKGKGRNRERGGEREEETIDKTQTHMYKWANGGFSIFFSLCAKVLLLEYLITKQSSVLWNVSFLSSLLKSEGRYWCKWKQGYSIPFKTICSRKCY